jgi:hypothetical protein
MNLQFFHSRYIHHQDVEGTLVVQVPPKHSLESLLSQYANQILLPVGLAILRYPEQFIKKTGRDIAIKNMQPLVFEFTGLDNENLKHIYELCSTFTHNKNTYYINIKLSTVKESDKVRLIKASIEQEDVYV